MASPIEHVVVLMLENRSFDHLFGLHPGVDGIAGKALANRLDPAAPVSAKNPSFEAGPGASFAVERGQGPSHSLNGTNVQLFNDKTETQGPVLLSGFVRSYADALRHDRVGHPSDDELAAPMRAFSPGDLPALDALAREFVLCDRWFSEVPGPTMPNRLYVHAATSAGYAHNDWSHVFDFRTIYNSLVEAGRSWAVYFSDEVELARFSQINQQRQSFRVFEERFVDDARAGELPSYTFIVPRFAAGQEPGQLNTSMHAPQDLRPGDALVAQVYEALRAHEAAWSKTLFIVTFDEHGGFHDHVAPPRAPSPDGISSPAPDDTASFAPFFAFDRLGLRVPTLLVSPRLPRGKVDSTPYQHTSILATLRELFDLGAPLTARDAAAKSFAGLLLPEARLDTPASLPRIAAVNELALLPTDADDHPGQQPTDAIVDRLVEGWDALLKAAPKAGRFELFEVPAPRPATMAEAGAFLRSSVLRYLDRRAAAAAPGAEAAGGEPRLRSALPPESVLRETAARFRVASASSPPLPSPVAPLPRRNPLVSLTELRDLTKRFAHFGLDETTAEFITSVPRVFPHDLTGRVPRRIFDAFERYIGENDLLSFDFIERAARAGRSVGRVVVRGAGGGTLAYGTGFLIAPRLLITNHHVLSSAAEAAPSAIDLNYQMGPDDQLLEVSTFHLEPEAFFLTSEALDYTVVAVAERSAQGTRLDSFGHIPLTGDNRVTKKERVNIIQHPSGQPKQIAIRDNEVVDVLDDHLKYVTDTAPGSSGAGVFNEEWSLVALHHSGVPRRDAQGRILARDGSLWAEPLGVDRIDWESNEGVRIDRIVADLRGASLDGAARALLDAALPPTAPGTPNLRARRVEPAASTGDDLPRSDLPTPGAPEVPRPPAAAPLAPAPAPVVLPLPAAASTTVVVPLQITVSVGLAGVELTVVKG
jgi:phospholipase C